MARNSYPILPSEVLNQTQKPVVEEEETQADGRKLRAEDVKDFDEDGEEGGDSVVVEMSQLVVR